MINQLSLFNAKLPKIRFGYPWDGGYVIPIQALCQSEALFSYGVGTDISLEVDYIEATNKKAYLFDHTIDNAIFPDWAYDKAIFTKEGISGKKTKDTDHFFSHYDKYFKNSSENSLSTSNKKVLFKCDVEGCEYEFLLNTDMQKMSEITTGLLFEFHSLKDPETRKIFFECVEKINKYFYLCHVHGNNYGSLFNYFEDRFSEELNKNYTEKFSIPSDIELSFVNKKLVVEAYRDFSDYPSKWLDKPNNPSAEDLDLSFLKKI